MPKLFMLLIGCKPKGRKTEQHDIYFGLAEDIRGALAQAIASWPEAGAGFHLDAWREVKHVDNYRVRVTDSRSEAASVRLFFINLGGYKPGEFDEFHYRMLVPARDVGEALRVSKKTAFFRHTGFDGASAHVDDKYGVDVDDIFDVEDILEPAGEKLFHLVLEKAVDEDVEDQMNLGYFKPSNVDKWAPPHNAG